MPKKVVLSVRDLETSFHTESGQVKILDGVSLEVKRSQTLGIVGESGCGKSVTALSIMRLLPQPAGRIDAGQVLFDGVDLARITPTDMQHVRGRQISMIFQEPMTSLNPVHKVGKQIAEVFELHFSEMTSDQVRAEITEILTRVGIPDPERIQNEYPHQLSGGMRQRAMIAMALACKPAILIADEPTTALDVTIQAQIIDLMRRLQAESGMSMMFITHDLGVIAELCDEVIVMYAGRVIEKGPVGEIFHRPRHPYTQGLLASLPRLESVPKSELQTIEGMVPPMDQMPSGCRFRNRCAHAAPECELRIPALEEAGESEVACIRWETICQ